MCGIVGYWGAGQDTSPEAMSDAIRHRGPDDAGWWRDTDSGISLGHRRLAILDLSPAGHQPMESVGGRYVLVFNGEIYNHLEIRSELEALGTVASWRGHSDTETLLAAFNRWGVTDTLRRTVGMFAIAVWDREHRNLTLARDRMGEKPLYYGRSRGRLYFASELKALRASPSFDATVDRGAVAAYLRHGYVPTPWSIYVGVRKLSPGCTITFHAQDETPDEVPYWSMVAAMEAGRRAPFVGSDTEATDTLERILGASVRAQMVADVPLGAFLSGGVDSSAVVALMQSQATRPVRTFTIGFDEAEFNESEHAARVAKHLGTEHEEWHVTPRDAQSVIPKLASIWDEPFSDSSQIPTVLVSALAKRRVTVSLSGDGGDELFWGYSRYLQVNSAWLKIRRIPIPARLLASACIRSVPVEAWERVLGFAGLRLGGPSWRGKTGDRLHKIAEVISAGTRDRFYRESVSLFKQPCRMVRGVDAEPDVPGWSAPYLRAASFLEEMAYRDTMTYLPDDILAKVDRAGMSVSLESRIPMLDHRVVEFAATLPAHFKVRNGQGKWILRQMLYRHVPREIIERPKQGFGVPIASWLRGPLRDWGESLLNESRMTCQGYLNVSEVRRMWDEHQSGRRNWQHYLWTILMFQAWLEEWER